VESIFFHKYRKKVINVCDDLLNLSAEVISSLRGPLKNYKEGGTLDGSARALYQGRRKG
jgi:hypothetical protein